MPEETQGTGAAGAQPQWLSDWRHSPIWCIEALRQFDALQGIEPEALLGRWRGASLPTGHPLDGLLEKLGWYGKAFESRDRVRPLLFRDASGELTALDPALMPVTLALRAPRLARSKLTGLAFSTLRPFLGTRHSGAALRAVEFRGRRSTAMVYDRQPIIDHFRRIDEARTLGLMEIQSWPQPFFFLLSRDDSGSA
ncbi:MAG: DUF4334 domain-containing protein [Amaricoccus sp.]